MRWQNERRSDNVEDRRGRGAAGGLALGGGGLVIVLLIALFTGVDPGQLLNQLGLDSTNPAPTATQGAAPPANDEMSQFVAVVLAQTEDVWKSEFQRFGRQYEDPQLTLFTDRVESACGLANAAVGPFYCPEDRHVYIDLSFYELLRQRLGAPGDFAQAYVIAHEVGHHVQNLLGVTDKVHAMKSRLSASEYNRLSVRLELQADFYAGVWAHHTQRDKGVLEPGDVEEAMAAAEAIGDDRLQKQSQGYVVPDAFTHGTSEQRQRWFMRGYETGDMREGDTFSAEVL
ncbi:MAG: hypothetical protein HOP12_04865 [Candidatus Eisenbacteria bacterium]|uniref:Metalloprotease n=1 Tax=Eiseniibacteriota bacterium TaxID=2212470 RepID=A0A849SG57_UNCEI|nr:hypothetical protein [Candidatus Eisenbacteria bacterium]